MKTDRSMRRAQRIIAATDHIGRQHAKPSNENAPESTVEGMTTVLKVMLPAFRKAQQRRAKQ